MAENGQSRAARRKQQSKKKKKRPIWKKILLAIVLVFALCFIAGISVFGYYAYTAPDLDASMLSDPASNVVLDMNGEEFAELGDENRTKITYDELPDVLVDAVVATEDSRFFEHSGIDLIRTGGALLANFRDGFGAEGGSTIDQQLVKQSFLSPDKTIKRKVQEWWLAFKLDREYSKEEILEMYLNKVFYGQYAYGVATAAETYFGVTDLSELTLPQAALLAGLPQRPTAYNPFENPDLAQERMNTVLSLMVQHGKITQEEADEAAKTNVEDMLTEKQPQSNKYAAFLKQVQNELSEKLEGTDLNLNGMKIYTTLDPDAQETVEYALSEDSGIAWNDDELQAGITLLDTTTGAIRAIGGNRGNDTTGYNYAIDGTGRQPGSTMKPILDYGPAYESETYTSTYEQILDEKIEEGFAPNNYDDQFHGWMSARTALAKSYNVPAVKTFNAVGSDYAEEFANGLGLEFTGEYGIQSSDSIGGGQNFRTIDIAGAYAAFGNEGIYNEPYAITKIEFSDGSTIDLESEPQAAMSEATAYMITDMLKTVMDSGTGVTADVAGLPVAGKTGTTNLESGGTPDAWMTGYTTNYTLSIWTGHSNGNEAITGEGDQTAKKLFKQIMTNVSEGKDTADFTKPSSVVEAEVEKGTNPAASPSAYTPSSEIVTELFLQGHEPSSTSQTYDQLDAVSGLSASYNEESNTISIDWDYSGDASFLVRAGNGGSLSELTTTSDTSAEISSVEAGTTYTIEVTAVADDETSDPQTTSVDVPGESEEEQAEEPENPDEENSEDQSDEENQEENSDENTGQNQDNSNEEESNGNGQDDQSGDNGNSGNNGNTEGTTEEENEGDSGQDSNDDSGSEEENSQEDENNSDQQDEEQSAQNQQ